MVDYPFTRWRAPPLRYDVAEPSDLRARTFVYLARRRTRRYETHAPRASKDVLRKELTFGSRVYRLIK